MVHHLLAVVELCQTLAKIAAASSRLLGLVLYVIGHRGILGEGLDERLGWGSGGVDVFGGKFVSFSVAREDLARNRQNSFEPRTVDSFNLAGLRDGDIFGGFGRYLTWSEGSGGGCSWGFGFGFELRGCVEAQWGV